MCFSCEQDSNLMGSDFDNEESGVAGIKRYWAVLYVFKFYNSNDIFFSCTVTVCPSGSSSCDIVSTDAFLSADKPYVLLWQIDEQCKPRSDKLQNVELDWVYHSLL